MPSARRARARERPRRNFGDVRARAEKTQVLRELSKLYTKTFRPIEEATKFDVFYSSLLNEAEFRTPPMVLLVGPRDGRVATNWSRIFRGDESRRRRGRDVDIPWRRVAAAPRVPRGNSVENEANES